MSEGHGGRGSTQTLSVALTYDGAGAPRVTAKGRGELGREIRELAEAHDVPLYDDPALASVLAQIELGEEIPETLYVAVAEVIAFAYMVSGRTPPGIWESGDRADQAGEDD